MIFIITTALLKVGMSILSDENGLGVGGYIITTALSRWPANIIYIAKIDRGRKRVYQSYVTVIPASKPEVLTLKP